jgi:hypothetical protein
MPSGLPPLWEWAEISNRSAFTERDAMAKVFQLSMASSEHSNCV